MSSWLFYDETNTMASYAINKINYIYYILFSITMVPFQLIMDVLFLNILEQQWDCDFVDYLIRSSKRFKDRKHRWILHDHDHKEFLQYKYRTIDATCFSSQYYFSTGLNLSGISFCIMGIQTVSSYQYNALMDFYLIPFCIIWIGFMILYKRFMGYIADKLKIYKIKKPKTGNDSEDMSVPSENAKAFRNKHKLTLKIIPLQSDDGEEK